MNFTGRLFTGVIALVLIGTACVIPIYLADKWEDVELEGRGSVPVSELLANNTVISTDIITTGQSICIPYWQSNNDNMILLKNHGNTNVYGKISSYYKSGGYWYAMYNAETVTQFDYNEFGYDLLTHSDPGSLTYNYMWFYFLVSAQDMLNNNVNRIRVHLDVRSGVNDGAYYLSALTFGRATGTNTDPTLYGISYIPAGYGSIGYHPDTIWINLTSTDLNSIASWQNTAYDIFAMGVYSQSQSGMSFIWNVELYEDYYDPYTMNIHTYENSTTHELTYDNYTIWTGADVTVSYLDIQRWILGLFGIGIFVLALAVSPFWNPIKDYAYRRKRKD